MTLEDILTLSKAGYTAQQITAMSQPMVQAQPQMVQAQPQMVQSQPQMVQPQMVQVQPQMVRSQPQMVQPNTMMAPQVQQVQQGQQGQQVPQMVQPQMVQPQMAQPQMVQNYPQFGSNGQYNPVLPQNNTAPAQTDPMKDVMLEQYMNVPSMNMYDVKGVVADMIGANPPMNLTNNTGGKK